MPPTRRRPRRKAAEMQDTSEIDVPESSPSRPSAKKRKVNGTRASTRRKSTSSELDRSRLDESADESEAVSQSDLIDSIVSYLQSSKEHVTAVGQYSNEKGEDQTEKVTAYAKIAGRDWTYFVREQSVNIGRPPDERQTANGAGASSPIADLKDVLPVHIDLGPSKIVSRHHASIFYDGDFPDGGGWHVRVNGRNGVRVNNVLLKRGSRQQITSGSILEIAGTQMMFVTPRDPVQIDQYFIDRAKAIATGEDFPPPSHAHPEPAQAALPRASAAYPSLAPAPADFKRASTPPQQSDGKNQRGVFDSKSAMSPMYGRGMMMESTQEIDYSRDSAKDLKPPYSYATMIAQAIFSSEEEKLTLSNIYSFIADKYAFYRHSNSGWQNSIRHNLSLNKAFQKVPRRTDEPGKGMKWQIAPEFRQEYWKKQARKSGGSAPSSPASGKDVNPNFRGPNGQNLGYDTSMVSSFSAKDMSHPSKMIPMSMQYPPYPPSQYPSGPSLAPPSSQSQDVITPQRRRTDTQNTIADGTDLDDSPLPNNHLRPTPRLNGPPVYTLPSSVPPAQHSPTNPTLSSSYLDTPFHPSQHSIITPAPLRQNPRLAPPSTLVAPSKFMPESSPAGPGLFWKGLMGVTPGQALPDMSPDKDDDQLRANGLGRSGAFGLSVDRSVMSSSPPPVDTMGSPSKPARGSQIPPSSVGAKGERENGMSADLEDERSRSLSATATASIGQQRNGSAGPPLSVSVNASHSNVQSKSATLSAHDDNDDDGEGGFDLAKGFAPIAGAGGGFRSGSVNAR